MIFIEFPFALRACRGPCTDSTDFTFEIARAAKSAATLGPSHGHLIHSVLIWRSLYLADHRGSLNAPQSQPP
jgi:hypothetical protein